MTSLGWVGGLGPAAGAGLFSVSPAAHRPCGACAIILAGFPPEGLRSEGSAGAEALRSCRDERAPLRRPRTDLSWPRVRTRPQRAWAPTCFAGHRPGAAGGCRSRSCESGRCGRASMRFVAVTHSLGRTTRNRAKLPAPARATERNDGSSGTVPCPASDAQACRVPSSGRDEGSMGQAERAGITKWQSCNRGHACSYLTAQATLARLT